MGYNLKATDMQAAIGCAQLEKLDEIVRRRRENFEFMHKALEGVDDGRSISVSTNSLSLS